MDIIYTVTREKTPENQIWFNETTGKHKMINLEGTRYKCDAQGSKVSAFFPKLTGKQNFKNRVQETVKPESVRQTDSFKIYRNTDICPKKWIKNQKSTKMKNDSQLSKKLKQDIRPLGTLIRKMAPSPYKLLLLNYPLLNHLLQLRILAPKSLKVMRSSHYLRRVQFSKKNKRMRLSWT